MIFYSQVQNPIIFSLSINKFKTDYNKWRQRIATRVSIRKTLLPKLLPPFMPAMALASSEIIVNSILYSLLIQSVLKIAPLIFIPTKDPYLDPNHSPRIHKLFVKHFPYKKTTPDYHPVIPNEQSKLCSIPHQISVPLPHPWEDVWRSRKRTICANMRS